MATFTELRQDQPSASVHQSLSKTLECHMSYDIRSYVNPTTASLKKWKEAVSWAVRAWEAVYFGFIRTGACSRHTIAESPANEFVQKYAVRYIRNSAIDWLKYHCSYIWAYGESQTELPLAPSSDEFGDCPGIFAGGWVYTQTRRLWARARGNHSVKARDCLMDLNYVKIGMPPAPAEFVQKTLDKHQAALCRDVIAVPQNLGDLRRAVLPFETAFRGTRDALRLMAEGTPGTFEKIRSMLPSSGGVFGVSSDILYRTHVKRCIDRMVEHMFHDQVLETSDRMVSSSSCVEKTMKDGGALVHLIDRFFQEKNVSVNRLVFPRVLLSMRELLPGEVFSFWATDYTSLSEQFNDWVDWRVMELLRERKQILAVPCAILEPLKVRVITKSSAFLYYRAVDLQKMMHSTMRKFSFFKYIGQPIDEKDFQETFTCTRDGSPIPMVAGYCRERPRSGSYCVDVGRRQIRPISARFYVSADYSAATDNLDPELSRYAWKAICRVVRYVNRFGERVSLLGSYFHDLGERCLVDHVIRYKLDNADRNSDHVDRQQTWGQLMGSPMSFPILCLINSAIIVVSMGWDYLGSRRMWDCPLRVNGDDAAFISDSEHYDKWCHLTAMCGLSRSVGKNFISHDTLIMNSETRRLHDGVFKLHGFVNQSILRGLVRKGLRAGQPQYATWYELDQLQSRLIRGFDPETADALTEAFLVFHKEALSYVPTGCNYWLPKPLGGLGLKGHLQEGSDAVRRELVQAACLYNDPLRRLAMPVTTKTNFIKKLLKPYAPKQFWARKGEYQCVASSGQTLGQLIDAFRSSPDIVKTREGSDWNELKVEIGHLGDLGDDSVCLASSEKGFRQESLRLRREWCSWTKDLAYADLTPLGRDKYEAFEERYEQVGPTLGTSTHRHLVCCEDMLPEIPEAPPLPSTSLGEPEGSTEDWDPSFDDRVWLISGMELGHNATDTVE